MTSLKKLSELFTVESGLSLVLNKLTECKKSDVDSINFVSRTDYNNGISSFVKKRLWIYQVFCMLKSSR